MGKKHGAGVFADDESPGADIVDKLFPLLRGETSVVSEMNHVAAAISRYELMNV